MNWLKDRITRLAEWWLDVDHWNLLEVGAGTIGPRGEFIPWQTKMVSMTLHRGRLRPLPIVFDAAETVTITHYSRKSDIDEWCAPKVIGKKAPYHLISGDSLSLTLSIGLS